ncbi:hypothetical protein HanRHA438_Chr07g0309871 [Helianthus annuus]|uniref:Uncharacterized protein n=1 Tax=Helianthus annuus TaxID=4232 RepID=A0A251TDA8_HELAN|nr:hypothetical protein HanXRQr2_Chr07g0299671 [Helianthus annuus]KAJ0557283.1 hypothetical protein HanIR_Chr07g0323441 [Helianthus annuus]KAJ0563480.1 hypothetical protein HanHA89_Chr07g0263661 [Helianthus annuus]KAJ0728817.1 hypothetical protein HanLR1_Chr07g0246021 [Helianthus annuus]KAJ0731575.1 hypothetical protein HanOQP8_Chr07g0253591 [Helianthus annuus]
MFWLPGIQLEHDMVVLFPLFILVVSRFWRLWISCLKWLKRCFDLQLESFRTTGHR